MFSWKNIKITARQKVMNGESTTEKALGIAEVISKSIVSGATSVVKAAPAVASAMLDTAINNSKDEAQRDKAQKLKDDFDQKVESQKNDPSSKDKEVIELEKYEKELLEIRAKLKICNDMKTFDKLLKKERVIEGIIHDYKFGFNI